MTTPILIGTESGLWMVDGTPRRVEALAERAVIGLARNGTRTWAVVGGRSLWAHEAATGWQEVTPVVGPPATCLAPTAEGLLIGTEEAHLFRLVEGAKLEPVRSFDEVEGRGSWYTPWGDPADVRSIAVGAHGAIYVNVHVGGIVCSGDGGRTWIPTVDIEADVHQVLAHPTRPEIVCAAAAAGFGLSDDGGNAWTFATTGLHAHYLRAVALADETVVVSASTGHRGRRSALYRAPLTPGSAFARCREGLPTWFEDNIDTACLAAHGTVVAFGTEDGRVFRSLDAGVRWQCVAEGLGPVRSVLLG